ncbi:MAG: hypothetical protein KF764_30040 [Labilithrix sp.]|nr:hypothetical protein [Labilithrix sp.]MBX3221391.1 hypothetical protein [Labilithrix sp.]
MHGWATLDTARCARCRIYTATSDLTLGGDGQPYCSPCGGPPVVAPPASPARRASEDAWTEPARSRLERRARVAVAAMLVVTFAFPLAACVSQL